MAERKRKPTGAVYGSLAYDLDAIVSERALDEAGRMPQHAERRRTEEVAQPRTEVQPKVVVSPLVWLSAAVLTVLVVVALLGHVRLTEISIHISEMKTEMEQLSTEHVSLLTEYEQTFELATVKEVAEAAGMAKPSAGQIEYVEVSGSNNAVIYAAGQGGVLDKAYASVKDSFAGLLEYFQ